MHSYKYDKVTSTVFNSNVGQYSQNILVDVVALYTEASPYLDNTKLRSYDGDGVFFYDECRHYFIRHATGSALSKLGRGQYNVKTAISGFQEVYAYNTKY